MWLLKKDDNTSDSVFYLSCGESLKVGRVQGANIHLLSDKSVSREHASIFVIFEDNYLSCEDHIPEVILQDQSSTYGTYVNEGISSNTKIPSQEPLHLKDKDKIRFGQLNSIFSLTYEPLIVTSSQIVSQVELRKNLIYLGGHLVKEWTNKCCLLVMQELKLTAKTASALASGSNIVTPAYIKDMCEAVKSRMGLPDSSSYIPQLKEPSINGSLVSFAPDHGRKSLFKGKTFLFQKKVTLKRMRTVVSLAGGESIELLESNFPKVIAANHILVKSSEKEQDPLPSFISKTFSLLGQKGLNAIPESDIGLAILHKDMEKYCNPSFKVTSLVRPRIGLKSQVTEPLHIYATETQEDTELMCNGKRDPPTIFTSRTTIIETGVSTKNDKQVSDINELNKNTAGVSSEKSATVPKITEFGTSDTCISTGISFVTDNQMEEKQKHSKRKRERSSSSEKLPLNKRHSFLEPIPVMKRNENVKEAIVVEDIDTEVFNPTHFSTERALLEKGNVQSEETRVVKSIPFDAYTLPSLRLGEISNTDLADEEPAQHFIKKEPEKVQVKREIDVTDHINVMGKRDIENVNEKSAKRQRPSPEKSFTAAAAQANSTVLFAAPFPSSRQRRRAKENSNISSQNNEQKESNLQLINLPTTIATLDSNNLIRPVKNECTATVAPFICKEDPIPGLKHIGESKTDDVQKLGENMEKSLIIVEVTSLVRPKQLSNSALNSTSFGMVNFKRFKKVSSNNQSNISNIEVSVLPKIIGGRDLIAHSAANSRREEFLASQSTSDTENENIPTNNNLDPSFLQPFPNMSRRRRIR